MTLQEYLTSLRHKTVAVIGIGVSNTPLLRRLRAEGMPLVIYEPTLKEDTFYGDRVEKDLDKFKAECDVILANRAAPELADVAGKVYTRDLYSRD